MNVYICHDTVVPDKSIIQVLRISEMYFHEKELVGDLVGNIKQRERFYQNFISFLNNFTLHCYHWIVESRHNNWER